MEVPGKQIDNAILKIHGIIKEEDTMPQHKYGLSQVKWQTSGFCSLRGMVLRVDVSVDIKKKRSDIAMALVEFVEKEPEIAKILRKSV